MSLVCKLTPFPEPPLTLLHDPDLSFGAKGIFMYLLRRSKDGETSIPKVVEDSSDGIHAVRSALEELEEVGYLHRFEQRKEDGRYGGIQYVLCGAPRPKENVRSEFSG